MRFVDARKRIAALERRAAARIIDPAEPWWSEAHACTLESRGGFHMPSAVSCVESERQAIAYMEKLTRGN